ncbi:MAG: hypothetical protein L0211_12440 [Planctomycetaceae bacterium]|nr:hypothetical protein [Planctomycetaceae bacterium]
MDADAEGVELWKEELSQASGPIIRRQGAMEGNGLVALLASVALLLASAAVLIPKFNHLTRGEWTVGIVVGHQSYGYGSGSIRAPIIRYSAPGGVFDKLADIPAATGTYPLGKEVYVLFLRSEPGNAVVADFVQLCMIPTVVGCLGLTCLSCSATFMVWQVRPELFTKAPVATRREFAAAPTTGDQKDAKDASGQNESQDANSQNDSQDADGQNDSQDVNGQNDSQDADGQNDSQDVNGQNDAQDADCQDDSENVIQGNQEIRRRSHWG